MKLLKSFVNDPMSVVGLLILTLMFSLGVYHVIQNNLVTGWTLIGVISFIFSIWVYMSWQNFTGKNP